MESLVITDISCSLQLTHQQTTTNNSSISLSSSPHAIPSSTKLPPSSSTTTTIALLNVDKSKSTASPLLPLPPSRPLFPSPLKFLWFGKNNPSNPPAPKSPHPSPLPLKTSEFDSENAGTVAPKLCNCFLDSDGGHASNADLNAINKETHKFSGQTIENSNSTELLNTEECSLSMSNSPSDSERNWISRFLQLRLLWKPSDPEPKSSRELVESTLLIAACKGADQALKAVVVSGRDDDVVDDVIDGSCGLSTVLDEQGVCMQNASRERVVHDKQSVSRFLHEVPVAEVQAISKLCLLSNLAYIVPEVQSKNLLKEHGLSFVTSSLVKKEEAEAKVALERSVARHAGKQKNIAGGKENLKKREEVTVGENGLCDAGSLDKASLKSSQRLLCVEAPPKEAHGTPNVAPHDVQVVKTANEERTSVEQTTAKERTLKMQGNCPCEWFICDDEASNTRYLAIQGSESLASWQTNLAFDPTKFEGLGVLVHRGVYEAAQGLYQMVEREMVEHTRKGSHTRVCFTGHSLGGSLAMLLAMMLVKRGRVKANAVEGVVMLGAACVLCAGERWLMQLGLQEKQVVNIVMHRDIVPRAFTCDYPHHVVRLLKRLNSHFRDHPCLNYQHRLYAPVGQVMILQPDEEQSPGHPLLPSKLAGLYLIKHPQEEEKDKIMNIAAQATLEVQDAQRAFFNMPHPLDMLRDPGAYGFEGAISRDHDPRSYKRAITTVISQALRRLSHLRTQQRRRQVNHKMVPQLPLLWDPLITHPSPYPTPIVLPKLAPSASSPRRKQVLHHSSRLIDSQHIHIGLLFLFSMTTDLFSSFLSWV